MFHLRANNRSAIQRIAARYSIVIFDKGFYMLDQTQDMTQTQTTHVATQQTLSSLKPGKRCRVHAIGSSGVMRRRLMDLGLVPNAEITLLRAAPLNDPIEIRVGNAFVSLRRAEAAKIEVVAL